VARRVLPDADPAATLETAVERSIKGYTAMLQEPDTVRPARRAVERLYDVRVRLDPRRRAARR
jgi:hypothetical protein